MKTKALYLILAATVACLSSTSHAEITDVIEKTFEFNDNGRISLSNINGDVSISACNCAQVHLIATITASDQETRDRINVDIDSNNRKLSIKTKYKKSERRNHSRNRHSEVTYELTVPNKVELDEIALVNGDLEIRGVTGLLNAELVNGELNSDAGMSDTEVSMVNGDIHITFQDLDKVDRIKLESVNGTIAVKMPSDADLDVSAETVSGKITNEFGLSVHKGRYVGSDMHGTLGDGSVSLSMENVNGRIRLDTL
ncbi:MAG: hypothetical protein KUG78_20520 [Kangiellaceae bacterium]|nr:hypothetical protein [Kangiellaceae bacterium]